MHMLLLQSIDKIIAGVSVLAYEPEWNSCGQIMPNDPAGPAYIYTRNPGSPDIQNLQEGGEDLPTISLCMIVRNEENSLGRCLSSVADLVDEIVIVDTGSTDRTKEIAAGYGARLYDFEWIQDFAAARNYSFSHAACEYMMWLDADDVIEEIDRERFKALKASMASGYHAVSMTYVLSTDENGKAMYSFRRNRLFRRDCGFQWKGAVHEFMEVTLPVLESDVCVTHKKDKEYTERNLDIYRKMIADNTPFTARDRLYYANELYDHGYYRDALENYERFLADGLGWIEDNIQACTRLADSHGALEQKEKQLQALCRSFEYDLPRPGVCCKIGYYFMDLQQYEQAVYWFNQATSLPNKGEPGTEEYSAGTWLPNLQLCVCYDKLGDHKLADYCNEVSFAQYPANPSAIYNRNYYTNLLGDKHIEINNFVLQAQKELVQ
ncbi:glycosyltransferase family 2 protein [Paenibacillus silagei]|uniref:Glycosyltransferase involved in cell wall biosynthesis n=1 Tax=Paenibacillus silagei TaxID=1670801 RepID=A0ABS4P3Q6_9BACL|nr:glycosyltransferase family 2 protein [Paenibacillus silagei]MBP2116350.1 glycosyltransferase involved in cell wall biosynthesis [Paenibacillus silagei]